MRPTATSNTASGLHKKRSPEHVGSAVGLASTSFVMTWLCPETVVVALTATLIFVVFTAGTRLLAATGVDVIFEVEVSTATVGGFEAAGSTLDEISGVGGVGVGMAVKLATQLDPLQQPAPRHVVSVLIPTAVRHTSEVKAQKSFSMHPFL